ncbi:MAG: 50S ribosomal protein L10 [Candidatus Omnitrophica bacterium]|nr:50S ribosomal protein L10 [Candidatus Omnitrophota bacterium]MBD3269855.1 50S ribosomal protein L10 [Candidatus Omnitrophota bacterium]
MKKIGLLTREKIVDDLRTKIQETNGCIFISFHNLKAFGFNTLRNDFKEAKTSVFVTKNSLFKRIFEDLGHSDIGDFLEDETGIALVYDDDVVGACKILANFAKENEGCTIKGGFIKEKKITSNDIMDLSKLPSREVLLGMAVSGLASPLTGFLNSLNQIILKFLWVVEEIKKTKDTK